METSNELNIIGGVDLGCRTESREPWGDRLIGEGGVSPEESLEHIRRIHQEGKGGASNSAALGFRGDVTPPMSAAERTEREGEAIKSWNLYFREPRLPF